MASALPSQRFGRERRLRRRRDFLHVQASRARVVVPHFVCLVAAQDPPSVARLGLVVSKKIGCAVARNRVKRTCREAYRTMAPLVPPGVDLVLIARAGADALGTHGVRRELEAARGALASRARAVLRAAADAAPSGSGAAGSPAS